MDIDFFKEDAHLFLQSSAVVDPQCFYHLENLFIMVHQFFRCQDDWDVWLVPIDHNQMFTKYFKIVPIFGEVCTIFLSQVVVKDPISLVCFLDFVTSLEFEYLSVDFAMHIIVRKTLVQALRSLTHASFYVSFDGR